MSEFRELIEPLVKAARAMAVLLGHLLVVGAVVLAAEGLEQFIGFVRHGEKWLLFDNRVPVSYIFDAFDLGVLLLLVFWGLIEANKVLKGE